MFRHTFCAVALATLFLGAAMATIFGEVRGVVHDQQHRPIEGATVELESKSSDWSKSLKTDSRGEFWFNAVPLGEYSIHVTSPGFAPATEDAVVHSCTEPVVHFRLRVGEARETINVSEAPVETPTDSVTPSTLVDRRDIQRAPGAVLTNSQAMITDYVPGTYVTHDQLHVRGGHQTSWLVDGIPVPNTNIASNLGPQIDPKDIDYMEVNRGSYGAEFGDRTYAVFNIVPRTGFERNDQGELFLTAGNFYQTNAQLSIGSHTQDFAYYVSVNGNRSNLGLETPVPQVVHDATNGYGGFGTLIFNLDAADQLRLVSSVRNDYYQIPYDPNPGDIENDNIAANGFAAQYPSMGLRDDQHEADRLVNFSWVHTLNAKTLLTVSPFYHFNSANYSSHENDAPVAATDHRSSNYSGGQASFTTELARNNLQMGVYGFYQQDKELLGAIFNDGSDNPPFFDLEHPMGSLTAFFLEDKFHPLSWLTLSAGLRPTHFSGGVTENSISPRFGVAVKVPHLNWTLRAFYGHYYQPPPLRTASGPLVQFCSVNSCGFLALHGERDEEHQFGVTIPYHGWTLDADNFRTVAQNFFDHSCIGSGACFPITIAEALIDGWELTLRSPRIGGRAQVHLAYSNQVAKGGLPITGGLTNFLPPGPLFFLDHDQRNTLSVGGDVTLPWRSYVATNLYYGSGFSNAFPGQPYPGDHLPQHSSFDLSLGKDFGERWSASLNSTNVANRRVELDNSQTFGGFHWSNPREVYVALRYRFRY